MSDIISLLRGVIESRADDIRDWLEAEFQKTPALFYSSVDLRHSGTKIAPVDTNLFPAGFNNLSKNGHGYISTVIGEMITRRFPEAKKILLLPENHTRNQGYSDNLCYLVNFIEAAGYESRSRSIICR